MAQARLSAFRYRDGASALISLGFVIYGYVGWGCLFCSRKQRVGQVCLDTLRDHFADGRTALAAIERAAMMRLDGFRAAGTGIHCVANTGIVNASANANDHGSQLAPLRMIVN